jgi:hypothetical protein
VTGIDEPAAAHEQAAGFLAGAFGAANVDDSEEDYPERWRTSGVEVFVLCLVPATGASIWTSRPTPSS